MVKDDSGLADRGASADLGGQGPSRTGVALPRVEYFDGTGNLCASDGDGVGHALAVTAGATDPQMFEIARRCNAHPALVAALRDVLEDIGIDPPPHLMKSVRRARAALAQAEGAK